MKHNLCGTELKPFQTVLILSRFFIFGNPFKTMTMGTSKRKAKPKHPCGWCGGEIPEWRSNKKYCNEDHKNKFFNQLRKEADLETGRVNKILKKNFEILKKLIRDERCVKTKKMVLEKKGFNFDFMTHRKGEYRNCYLFAWRPIENDYVIVSRTPVSTFTNTE